MARSLQTLIWARCRQVFRWSPQYRAVRAAAQVGRTKQRCAECGKAYARRSTHVDHVEPVVPIGAEGPRLVPGVKASGWDTSINRLFCAQSNLRVLCKKCHGDKTKAEGKARRGR